MIGHNHVTLVGTLSEHGVTVRPLESTGTLQASCRLQVPEEGPGGQAWSLWVPVQAFGKAREVLETCEPGEALLVDGKLRWHSWVGKDGKREGMLVVVALGVKRLLAAAALAAQP